MSKKLIIWLGIAVAVVIAAVIILLVVLNMTSLPKTPSAFGKTINEGVNYTLTVTSEDEETKVTFKRHDDLYQYILTFEDKTTEIFIKKDVDDYKLYTKEEDKWTYKTVDKEDVERYLIHDEIKQTSDVFNDDNYKKEGNIFSYTGENKSFSGTEFTSLTIETSKDSTIMKIVSKDGVMLLAVSDVNNTKVTLPETETAQEAYSSGSKQSPASGFCY